jgi:hypothetical protein
MTQKTLRVLLMATLMSVQPSHGSENIQTALVVVQNRGSLEPVHLRALFHSCTQVESVRFVEGVFQVAIAQTICFGVPPGGQYSQDFTLGRLPQGQYRAKLFANGVAIAGTPELTFEVAAPPDSGRYEEIRGLIDLTGAWRIHGRPGESMMVQHETGNDRLLITWNTYRPDGSPEWLVAVSELRSELDYQCALYRPGRSGLERIGTLWFGNSRQTLMGLGPANAGVFTSIGGANTDLVVERYWSSP